MFPPGFSDLRDLPFTLFEAITAALTYLAFGEMLKDKRPPRHIWCDGRALTRFFEDREQNPNESVEIEDPRRNDAVSMLIAD